ncbi:MAG TPA: helix-turn-helix domain-containing protein [Pseudonocardiaceae bacterium]|nr:helix-turn-helix domain-containing protein [Pseudonocardiaceae bacterium]
MPRRERLLDQDSADPLVRFALELRALRRQAGDPTYRVLAGRAGFSVTTLADAASGRGLPTLAVIRAYVGACGGDVAAWERRWHGLASARTSAVGEPPDGVDGGIDTTPSPYVGLAAFEPGDADRFFGRAESTAELYARVGEQRFVAVFGASGSGKSSLLRAGLVARWAGGGGRYVVLTPGEHPLDNYRAALGSLPEPAAADRADAAGDLLVVVDQFEEVFTVCRDEATRKRLIALLLEAANRPDSRVRVVLGVRTDFYSHCVQDPGLAQELRQGQFLVCPLTTEQLRAVITRPATQAGTMVETALVTQIVADCTGQRGVLPLLSHALRETWQRRSGATLTLAGYQAAGGIVHAIAQTAELVYTDLDEHEQRLAKSLFLRLVALGDGTEDTKRRITTAELDLTEPKMAATVARLTEARLVTVDHDQLEITHEALIRHWPRLSGWLTEDRDGLRVHRQLTAATAVWNSLRQDPAALYRGVQLAIARHWVENRDVPLTGMERAFLTRSTRAEEQVRVLARKRARRQRVLVGALSVLVVVAGSLSVVAATSRRAAVLAAQALARQHDQIEAQVLLDRAAAKVTSDPALAAQLSVAAYRLDPDQQTRSGVLNYAAAIHAWHTSTPGYPLGLSPDGRLLVTDGGTAIQLWTLDAETHHARAVGSIPHSADNAPDGAEFSPDGSRLFIDSAQSGAELWDTSNPTRPVLLSRTFSDGVGEFGSDRYLMVEGARDTVWDLADPRHPTRLAVVPGSTTAGYAAVSQDGRIVVDLETGGTNSLRLWDISDRRQPRLVWQTVVPGDPGQDVLALKGSLLAIATDTGAIQLWDIAQVDTPAYLGTVRDQSPELVDGLTLSSDGTELAASLVDAVEVWDVSAPSSPHLMASVASHIDGDPQLMLAFRSDTTLVTSENPLDTESLTGSENTPVYWWNLPAPGLAGRTVNGAISPAFSPDGRTMATTEEPGTGAGWTQLWNVSKPASPVPLRTMTGTGVGEAAVFAPSGQVLATATGKGELWDDSDLQRPRPLAPLSDAPLAFSSNGRMLATTGGVWDVTDPASPHRLLKFAEPQIKGLVVFSPDSAMLAVSGWSPLGSSVVFWDLDNPQRPRIVGHLPVPATQLVFLPGSQALVTITFSGQVQLWNVADPARPRSIASFSGPPTSDQQLLVSPDGTTLAIAGADSTTQLWDVTSPRKPVLLAVLTDATPEAFDPTGRTLAVLGTDGSIQLREVDTTHVIAQLCQSTPTIDRATWHRYAPNVPYQPLCTPQPGRP